MSELSPIEKHDQDLGIHVSKQSGAKAHIGGVIAAIATVILCTVITALSGFVFGFFKVVFGVLIGYSVRLIGKGSGQRFGLIAGCYAVAAVVLYELILSNFFVMVDPVLSSPKASEEMKEFHQFEVSYFRMVYEFGAAAIAFVLAYRIGKNPMKKDELDYLLEAKGVEPSEGQYSKSRFHKKRRR